MGAGTAGSETTALPKAASVGASITARTAISSMSELAYQHEAGGKAQNDGQGKSQQEQALGNVETLFEHTPRLALEASVNRTRAKVTSARVRITSASMARCKNPKTKGAKRHAKGCEYDSAVDRSPLQPPGGYAVEKDKSAQQGQVHIHRLTLLYSARRLTEPPAVSRRRICPMHPPAPVICWPPSEPTLPAPRPAGALRPASSRLESPPGGASYLYEGA